MTTEYSEALKDIYKGQEAWIVGKGPSLEYLTGGHFGSGPVIAMNESILVVQEFDIINPIYSMQKDGYEWLMVKPADNIYLVLQKGLSGAWFIDHPKRYIIDPVYEWGLHFTEMSIRICVYLAKHMGCELISFVCCDSLTNDDCRTFDVDKRTTPPKKDGYYPNVKPLVLDDVKDMPHRFIVPEGMKP